MKRMLLVFNPKSGRADFVKNLFDIIDLFSRAKYEVSVYPTTSSGDAYVFIKERGSNFDLIVCAGGDGMINETVNAYMNLENRPLLACIPAGTTNDFASSLGLPRDIMKAARSILKGQPHKIDIGAFGDKYFSYVAAFGWLTNVPYTTDQNAKNIFGSSAYLFESVKHLNNAPSIDCVIKIDDELINGSFTMGIIANGTSVAGYKKIGDKKAAIDDGLFEVLLAHKPQNLLDYQEILNTMFGTQKHSDLVIKRTAKKIKFTARPCDWTLDGEFGGKFEDVEIENLHHAISVILPQ